MMNLFAGQGVQWMVVGLGNPGANYNNTRHNLGFEVIDYLACHFDFALKRSKFNAYYTKQKLSCQQILFVKPQTFMNNSGVAVGAFARQFKIEAERIIVVQDDITIAPGKFKLKKGGSSGGHNGISSIEDFLSSSSFIRVKCGIEARPRSDMPLSSWVLGRFNEEEKQLIAKMLPSVAEAILMILNEGIDIAMNKFNSLK